MKKTIFVLAAAAMTLASCKKDYSCTCNNSGVDYYDSNLDGVEEAHPYANTYNIKIEGANKTQAAAACSEATIKQEDGMDTYQSSCELSK